MNAPVSACWQHGQWQFGNKALPLPAPLLWGHTVYTTFRWPLPEMLLRLHLLRLQRDIAWLGLPPASLSLTEDALKDALGQFSVDHHDWRIRLTVYPQVDSLQGWLASSRNPVASVWLSAEPVKRYQPISVEEGLAADWVSYQRSDCTIKHGQLSQCLSLRQAAANHGYQEVLLTNPVGLVTEGAFSAVAAFTGKGWAFPHPVIHGCLPSITVQWFQEWLRNNDTAWNWQAFRPADLATRHGLVCLSAIQGIVPVQTLNGQRIHWSADAITCSQDAQQMWAAEHQIV